MRDDPSATSVTHTTPGGIPARERAGEQAGGQAGGPAPDRAGPAWRAWTAGWTAGTRVVVRRRLPAGGWADVLGELLEVSPAGVTVATRRGPVHVPAADIALGKPVPPPPARRAPRPPDAAPSTPGPSTPGPSTPGPSTPGPSTPGPSTPGPGDG